MRSKGCPETKQNREIGAKTLHVLFFNIFGMLWNAKLHAFWVLGGSPMLTLHDKYKCFLRGTRFAFIVQNSSQNVKNGVFEASLWALKSSSAPCPGHFKIQ